MRRLLDWVRWHWHTRHLWHMLTNAEYRQDERYLRRFQRVYIGQANNKPEQNLRTQQQNPKH